MSTPKQGPNLWGGKGPVGQIGVSSIPLISAKQVISGAKMESENRTIAIFYDDEEIIIKSSEPLSVARSKMIMWALQNCEGRFHVQFSEYYFQFKDDAIAFKLRFGGE